MFFCHIQKNNGCFLRPKTDGCAKKTLLLRPMQEKSDTHTLKDTVAGTIRRHHLFPSRKVLVALSGGADSVALLRILVELGYDCTAAHCNFNLRGSESARDEAFTERLCRNMGIELETAHFDTKEFAESQGISTEMAARRLRYGFFGDVLRKRGIDSVTVAHHRSDNAETILLNTIRGTGIKGLLGMPYRRGNVVRPLLDADRRQIADYLRSIGQDWVDDSTNFVADVKRNVIRLKLMPLLRELNPSIEDTLLGNAGRLAEAYDFVRTHSAAGEYAAQDNGGTLTIRKTDIDSHLTLFMLLEGKGFTPSQTDDIWRHMDNTPGAVYETPTHTLLRDRDTLIIKPLADTRGAPGIHTRHAPASEYRSVPQCREVACLDADKVGDSFSVRPVRMGDRFVPLGMKGSKLVSDFMTDCKMDLFSKRRQTVMTNGKDIVWLVGQRIDDRYKVVEGQTTRLLICEMTGNDKQHLP